MSWGSRRRGSTAALAAVAGVLLSALAPLPSVQAATMWDACPEKVTGYPDRVHVKSPPFRRGGAALTSLAADPADPRRVVVGNGWELWRTDDAGCTWTLALPPPPGDAPPSLTVAAYEDGEVRGHYVFHGISVTGRGVFVWRAVGGHGETTWDSILPPQASPYECAPANPCLMRFAAGTRLQVGYASSGGPAGVRPAVARTADGGRTWETREPPAGNDPYRSLDLAVDSLDPNHLLALAGGAVFESFDGAGMWRRSDVPVALPAWARVAFAPQPVVVYGDGRSTRLLSSGDGGHTFVDMGLSAEPSDTLDVALGPGPAGPALHVAAGGRVYRHDGAQLALAVSQAVAIVELAPTTTGLWARSTTLSFVTEEPRAAVPASRQYRPPTRIGGRVASGVKARADGGTLSVGEAVRVPPDGSATTVVSGALARQPRGIDVFFLMDTSGSMAAKIAPMASSFASVVDALNAHGVAARFGLAEYGDRSFRYRRHADLGSEPAVVQQKLAALTATGGDEFHFTSFVQLATGAGLSPVVDGGPVPPGQQASFGPGALHVLVHATDDVDQGDPSGPTEGEALAALSDIEVRHIGIYPYDAGIGEDVLPQSDHSQDWPMPSLRRYARETGALAPAGGLDCDGDDHAELAEGAPIACVIRGDTSENAPIASLLTRVLLSLTSYQPVTLHVPPTTVSVGVEALGDYGALDLHEPHGDLEFRLTVTCPADMRGSLVDVPLELHVDGVTVAGGVLPVDCLAAPAPPRVFAEPVARPGPARVVGVVPPAAQAPPALAQSVASAQATSSASSGAQAAQVGMAVAPDDVVQVVTEEAGDDEMRFVSGERRPAPSPVVPAALGLAVVVVGLAVRPRVIEQRSTR